MKKQLENYLLQNIPISKALGIEVESASKERVILKAPFKNNINHKKTVFGGSLNAIATLSCWSLLSLILKESFAKTEIVIASSEIDFKIPIATDFRVICETPSQAHLTRFSHTLERKGKGRISLQAIVPLEEKIAVHFKGVFAAFVNSI